ncbi:hypothetical protein N7495_005538 [Penicillium taxi]|uniref:uncharacterized protein n=1 Tax=Penicillium taxi TaxID=168475 RepID=UPI002544FA24|nr:uncharacterized protein N7495_005538 [Penicillium taxi]KAJ5893847.1 hypothetical protein N7495_005538 [Penicillium taxi]
MGFFTGFISGFALTTSVLYITIQVHRSNRLEQRRLIREQVDQVTWIASSMGAYDRRFLPQDAPLSLEDRLAKRREQTTTKEVLKHRWNQEVEKLAHQASETRWEDVRATATNGWNATLKAVNRD